MYTTPASTLYRGYRSWCEAAGERPESQRSFGMRLTERGLRPVRGTGGQRLWLGLRPACSDVSDRSDADFPMSELCFSSREDNPKSASLASLASLDREPGCDDDLGEPT